MVPLRVGVLGPVTVWRDGHEHEPGSHRQLAVLGVLASRANRVVSRGELVDAVWGDEPPASAESGIYTYVAGLRRVLEPDRPRRDPDRSRRAPAGCSSPRAAATCYGSAPAVSTPSTSSGALARRAGCAWRVTRTARRGPWTRRLRCGAASRSPGCPGRSPRRSGSG